MLINIKFITRQPKYGGAYLVVKSASTLPGDAVLVVLPMRSDIEAATPHILAEESSFSSKYSSEVDDSTCPQPAMPRWWTGDAWRR
jgi:hypothetical protein